jgi:hypothetical protein
MYLFLYFYAENLTMKFISLFILSLTIFLFKGFSQSDFKDSIVDSALSKKLTVSNFCLCKTTLADLEKLDSQLQKTKVEEMDMCNDGIIQDSRFSNGKGYYSTKYPGMIFQKDDDNDFISKIRLTKDFIGYLPDGTFINMKTLLAKDVIKIYPKYANTWGSRGCSNYWNLSNDTLSFFVKIDKNKKPQYPVDEVYYGEMPIEGIDLVISCYNIFHRNRYKKFFDDPIFFIDSVNVTRIELQEYQPTQIAVMTIYKDTNAIKLVGQQGKDGVVYIETKKFARNKYWNYFKSKSPDYFKAVPSLEDDSTVVYILNGEIQKQNFEGDLSIIDDKTFIDLKVIGKELLSKNYGIQDKFFGVIINANIKTKKAKTK